MENRVFDSDSDVYANSDIHDYLKQSENVETFFVNYNLNKEKDHMVQVDVTSVIETTTKNTGSDYVFLLSQTEYNNYKEAIAKAGNSEIWWLRSPANASMESHTAYYVDKSGTAQPSGVTSNSTTYGLRPAFWYKLN